MEALCAIMESILDACIARLALPRDNSAFLGHIALRAMEDAKISALLDIYGAMNARIILFIFKMNLILLIANLIVTCAIAKNWIVQHAIVAIALVAMQKYA